MAFDPPANALQFTIIRRLSSRTPSRSSSPSARRAT
jgi:hypothetical protein